MGGVVQPDSQTGDIRTMAEIYDKSSAEFYRKRYAAMVSERSSWIPQWQEISRFISPNTSRYLSNGRNSGDKKTQEIIDITAFTAHRAFKSGMMAGTASAARPWFRLAIPDPQLQENKAVKTWLFTIERIMRDQIARSNYYKVIPMIFGSLGAYGTSATAILEDEEDVFRCYHFPIGSYVIGQNSRNSVDTFAREFQMTVRQLVHKFGIDNVSVNTKGLFESANYDQWISVLHYIGPNESRDPQRMDSKHKPFIDCYIEIGTDAGHFLKQGGFDEFPLSVPRWETNGEDTYGTNAPGMIAIGPTKGLQVEQKDKLMAIHKLVDPPMLMDATLVNQSMDRMPGGISYASNLSSGGGGRPLYEINPRINELMLDIQEVQQHINKAFYVDVMQMFISGDTPDMTAREVGERSQERMWAIGPIMESLNDEQFGPDIDRIFNIMQRRGMFPDPPPHIQGERLKVEYISIMAQAQKAMGVGSIERTIAFVGNLAAANPQVLDKLDMDQSVDEYAEMVGAPPSTIRSDEEVQQIREGRAKQEQMQQMAAMAQPLQQGAQAAKLLSETDDGTGRNTLATVLGLN